MKVRRQSHNWKVLLAAVTATAASVVGFSSPAMAASQTFYVNNQASNCSDSATGTSSSLPWCDFSPANSHIFGPGDHLLLARGATWNQELDLTGSGSSAAHIVVDAYGSGARPAILRNGVVLARAVLLTNPSFWEVNDIEVGNAGVGIEAYFSTLGHDTLSFSNDYAHDIFGIHEANQKAFSDSPDCLASDSNESTMNGIYESEGIAITGPANLVFSPSQYALTNLTLQNIEGTRNDGSFAVEFCNGLQDSSGGTGASLIQNTKMTGLNFHGDNGGGGQNTPGCPQGLRLSNMTNATVTSSIFDGEGGCATNHGTAGILFGRVNTVSFTGNTVKNTPETGSHDETGIDFEVATQNVSVQNNTISGTAGAGIELLAIHGSSDTSTGTDISGNTFVNNGTAQSVTYGGVTRIGGNITPSGSIHDNAFHEPTIFLSGDSSFAGFSISNNNPQNGQISFNRYNNGSVPDHWVTTDQVSAGYQLERSMGYLYVNGGVSGTVPLYGCVAGHDHFVSKTSNCEGQTVLRTEGYVYSSQPSTPATEPIYRCFTGSDHFVSLQSNCEGYTSEGLLGYSAQ